MSLVDVVAPRSQEALHELLETEPIGQHSKALQVTLLTKKKDTIEMLFHRCRLRGPNGSLVTLGIGRDVTDRKRAEELRSELLKNSIWREAAASFAHQIGNTLPPAQNRLNILSSMLPVDSKEAEHVHVAYDAVTKTLRLASDATRGALVSRVEMSREVAARVCAEIQTYCTQSWEHLMFDFYFDVRPEYRIEVDVDALREVFASLVSDAIKFHPQKQPTIRVAAFPETVDGRLFLTMLFEDDGTGIRAELKDRIFEPFFTTHKGGTGIGLTRVRRTIQLHNGEIKEGKHSQKKLTGVCFTIRIPICQ